MLDKAIKEQDIFEGCTANSLYRDHLSYMKDAREKALEAQKKLKEDIDKEAVAFVKAWLPKIKEVNRYRRFYEIDIDCNKSYDLIISMFTSRGFVAKKTYRTIEQDGAFGVEQVGKQVLRIEW